MTTEPGGETDDHRPVVGVADGGVETGVESGGSSLDRFRSSLRRTAGLQRRETRHIELWTRIATLTAEVDVLAARVDAADAGPPVEARLRVVRDLLTDAEAHLRGGRLEEAWGQYHGAQQQVVFVYDAVEDEESMLLRARIVYEEALDALSGAPRRTVHALLTSEGELTSPPSPRELSEAMRVLHDQYERVALTRRYLQSQFNQLLVQGTVALVLVLVLATLAAVLALPPQALPSPLQQFGFLADSGLLVSPLDPQAPVVRSPIDPETGNLPDTSDGATTGTASGVAKLQSVGFALYVVLVGILGASVFGMRTLRNRPLTTQAVRRTPGLVLTGARGFIGATSALFLVFVLFTGIVNDPDLLTAPLALAVAFAAGYSERLVPEAVNAVSHVVPSQGDGGDGDGGWSPDRSWGR